MGDLRLAPLLDPLLHAEVSLTKANLNMPSLNMSLPLPSLSEADSLASKGIDEQRRRKPVSQTSAAPLAGVLNHEAGGTQNLIPRKRQRMCDDSGEFLQLPKSPIKKARRPPRIPPLLQGLHQPPPEPDSGIFPRIEPDSVLEFLPSISYRELLSANDYCPPSAAAEPGKQLPSKLSKSEKSRTAKQRNHWTAEETQFLLRGVAKFGIGNWKRILTCTDFKFKGRSTVDLKDRYATFRLSTSSKLTDLVSGFGSAARLSTQRKCLRARVQQPHCVRV